MLNPSQMCTKNQKKSVVSPMFKKIRLSFIVVFGLIVLLVWLALLQYNWLEEVSVAQRKQLKETIQAAAQNISSDFNRKLSDIHVLFQYLNADSKERIVTQVLSRLKESENTDLYEHLVNHVLIYDPAKQNVIQFSSDFSKAELLSDLELEKLKQRNLLPETQVSSQMSLFKLKSKTLNLSDEGSYLVYVHSQLPTISKSFSVGSGFNFSTQSFTSRVSNPTTWVVLVELNQNELNNLIQHDLIQSYLGTNADELYDWSINSEEKSIMHNAAWETQSDSADVEVPIGELKSNAVIIVQSSASVNTGGSTAKVEILENFQTEEFSYTTKDPENRLRFHKSFDVITGLNQFNPDSILSVNVFKNQKNEFAKSDYQLLIRSKSGSLDAYVTQAKRKNLALSFGILGLLGVSLVMIAWNSHRLQDTAHQQMDFVAGVSHELKTPLAVIRSAAENVADGVVTREDQLKKYGRLIISEGQRLTGMVEQILEFAGIQSGNNPVKLSAVSSSEMASEWRDECHQVCLASGFELNWYEHPALPTIQADSKYIKSSLMNLLTNAMKYSDKEKRVIVRWTVQDWNKGRALAISVQDFGMGIHQNDQKQIFEPFFRTDEAKSQQIRGNGLGLHLVKRWMKAHQGDITLESKPGVGSTFTLYIPSL
ncbi:HAMP domain-containing histidine kinase [bacterium]|nr:MAG: HAMP domain-containing histidine kinase [bacterium]